MNCPSCNGEISERNRFCPSCGTERVPPPMPVTEPFEPEASSAASSGSGEHGRFLPGAKLAGRYRIVGLLGSGGMGEVYRADDLKLGQAVALKLLPERLADDPKRLEYFHNEVRLARQVSHPNVCRVYDIGDVDGQHFLSMEYVDGEDLAGLIRRIGRLPPDKGIDVARQVCAGLAAAHAVGVLHRDLKPANVMLDGRGRVRITDFGLARMTDEEGGADVGAGTPAYMAPEQLAGQEVTERSDVYSLGLLLFEVFTGKRAFKADTLAELVRLREDSTPSAPSNIVADIDPAVERVILQCLEKEPRERPKSALAVSAALPGGDPLAAALAAGETPSPEMVAASGSSGGLSAAAGVTCLVVLLVALCAVATLAQRSSVINNVPLDRKPDALEDAAKTIVAELGYQERDNGDSVYRFEYDMGYIEYLLSIPSSEAWGRLAKGRPPVIHFWYRQSPLPLAPVEGLAPDVSYDDPPRSLAGMVSVRLDSAGRLLEFHAVPRVPEGAKQGERSPVTPEEFDDFFRLAELDRKDFELSNGLRRPLPFFADSWACWHGELAGHDVDVTAASLYGKPVYFKVSWPWTPSERAEPRFRPLAPGDPKLSPPARTMGLTINLIVCLAAVLFARRNARLGRTDSDGARKIAGYVFLLRMLIWLLGPWHSTDPAVELTSFWTAVMYAVFSSVCLYFFYLALEPYVRRRWPEMLVSWSRLISGRFRDPRIGRDLLIGGLGGTSFAIIRELSGILASELSGTAPEISGAMEQPPNVLLGSGFIATEFLSAQQWTLTIWLYFLTILVLFTSLVRKQWLAGGLVAALFGGMIGLNSGTFFYGWVGGTALFALAVYILIRWGLICAFAAWFSFMLLLRFPITADVDAWYWGSSLFALGAVAALGVYGFYTSTTGRPHFGDRLAQP